MRAGRLTLGQDACLDAIRAGKAQLILIDEGVSPGTLKKFRDASEFHKVRMITLKAGQLAHSVGSRIAGPPSCRMQNLPRAF